MKCNELLEITTLMGAMLIECGAEIYRAEDSIMRISAAYGYGGRVEVFAIPTCVIVTVDGGEVPLTRQKRIMVRGTNLDRVDKLNGLSRLICEKKPPYNEIIAMLGQIKKRPVYSYPVQVISYAVVGATFALFFGGGIPEACTAGAIAVVIRLLETGIERINASVFLRSLLGAASAATIAVLADAIGLINGYDTAIIGSLMTLVPGVTLTNCMRDFIAGDFLAGLYTMTEALLIALGMAVGAAVPISLLTNLLGRAA